MLSPMIKRRRDTATPPSVPGESVAIRAVASSSPVAVDIHRLADLDDDTAREIVLLVGETRLIIGIGVGVPVLAMGAALLSTATSLPTWLTHIAVIISIAAICLAAPIAQLVSSRHLRRGLSDLGVDPRLAPAVQRTLRAHRFFRHSDTRAVRALQDHR